MMIDRMRLARVVLAGSLIVLPHSAPTITLSDCWRRASEASETAAPIPIRCPLIYRP